MKKFVFLPMKIERFELKTLSSSAKCFLFRIKLFISNPIIRYKECE